MKSEDPAVEIAKLIHKGKRVALNDNTLSSWRLMHKFEQNIRVEQARCFLKEFEKEYTWHLKTTSFK